MKKGFAPVIIIFAAAFLLVVGITAFVLQAKFFSKDKTSSPTPVAQATSSPKPSPSPSPVEQRGAPTSDETASCTKNSSTGIPTWKTCVGQISSWNKIDGDYKIYKFKFEVPNEFEPYHVYGKPSKYYFGAKSSSTNIFAGLMEGPGTLLVLLNRANKSNLCPKPFEVTEVFRGSFQACDTLQIDGRESLFLTDVYFRGAEGGHCERGASVYVIRNFGAGSSLLFTIKDLDILNQIIEPWQKLPFNENSSDSCPPDTNYNKVKENFAAQVKNIRNAENLSQSDTDKIHTLYQIISTFKFL